MKIYTNAKKNAYDEIINFHSSITNFSFELGEKVFSFERVNVNQVATLKLTVKEISSDLTTYDIFYDLIQLLGDDYGFEVDFSDRHAYHHSATNSQLFIYSERFGGDPAFSTISFEANLTEENQKLLKQIFKWVFVSDSEKVYNSIDFNTTETREEISTAYGLDYSIQYENSKITLAITEQPYSSYPNKVNKVYVQGIVDFIVSELGWTCEDGYCHSNVYSTSLGVKNGAISGLDFRFQIPLWEDNPLNEETKAIIKRLLPNQGDELLDVLSNQSILGRNTYVFEKDKRKVICSNQYPVLVIEFYDIR